MKYDNQKINNGVLKVLNENYNLSIDSIRLIPVGEESYCYLAEDKRGEKFFAKYCEKSNIIKNIETINNLLIELKNFYFIVPPIKIDGKTAFSILNGKVYVYPYIEGEVLKMPNEKFGKDLVDKLMEIILKIHSSGSNIKSDIPSENFTNNFAEKFEVLTKNFQNAELIEDIKKLFAENEKTVKQLIENHTQLGKKYIETKPEFVLTHGDITGRNIILSEGGLKLTDWDGAKFAPFEKDIIFLLNNSNFLINEYLEKRGKKNYDKELINYYGQQWSIDSIIDNFEKLLNKNISEEDKAESISEVEEYVGYHK